MATRGCPDLPFVRRVIDMVFLFGIQFRTGALWKTCQVEKPCGVCVVYVLKERVPANQLSHEIEKQKVRHQPLICLRMRDARWMHPRSHNMSVLKRPGLNLVWIGVVEHVH